MSNRLRYHAGALTLLGIVAAVSLAPAGMPRARPARPPVSIAIFPDQSLPLRFSHIDHIGPEGSDCDLCHSRVAGSRSSVDNLLPTEAACRGCHAIDRSQPDKVSGPGQPAARCQACHPGYQPGQPVPRNRIPTPNLKFDHAAHLSRGAGCSRCHGDLYGAGVTLATRAQLPTMAVCLSCHDDATAPAGCTTCHLTRGGGFLVTDFVSGKLRPSGALRGADHDLNFATDHRLAAQNDPRYCRNCHQEEYCIDCHDGVVKPMSLHGNDYVRLHAMDARRSATQCDSCHRSQSFCVGCHSRSGVAADGRGSEYLGPSSGDVNRRFHPPGWVVFDAGGLQTGTRSAEHHSYQAQRNLRQCASCHREEFCLTCHSAQVTSYGVSPHPRNWASSRRCQALAARNPRLCLRCHVDFREVSCDPLKF